MITAKTIVSKTGGSLCLILPRIWTRHHKLEHRQKLLLSFLNNGKMLVEVIQNDENRNEEIRSDAGAETA